MVDTVDVKRLVTKDDILVLYTFEGHSDATTRNELNRSNLLKVHLLRKYRDDNIRRLGCDYAMGVDYHSPWLRNWHCRTNQEKSGKNAQAGSVE